MFDSYAGATGASVTLTGLAITDVEIYKGTSVTQRSSDVGVVLIDTDGIDIDGVTGIHGFSIDTGDNTDAGFYAVGSFFTVVVSAVTIDSQTVNFVAGTFRLLAAETASGTPQARASAIADGAITASTIANASIDAATFATGAIDAAAIAADAGTEIGTAVWATTTRLLTAGTNIVLAKGTGVTGFNDLSAAQVNTEVDTGITDAALATAANLATAAAFIDTEVAAILADTNELQTDLVDGGRLDLLIDAIKVKTDNLTFTANAVEANVTRVGGVTTNVSTMATGVNTIVTAVDTEIAAIKAKTDSLTFTVAGQVDSNVQSINDVTITGDGQVGTEFGV